MDENGLKIFRNIALTFSGGGYRAASYSLGVLSYFNHVEIEGERLLDHVNGLSTVSGGTITGAVFCCFREKKLSFSDFFTHIYTFLDEDRLLTLAINKLSDNQFWKNCHKKRTLINAFASVYHEHLIEDTFDLLKNGHSGLRDFVFNATEFSNGLAFRFQRNGLFGNYKLSNSNLNVLFPHFMVADAIAASSCFPLGFEPIILPDDFISDKELPAYKAIKQQDDFKDGVGLMDGGIVDNQGIGSIRLTDNRREENDKFDLIMVCDVGSYKMDPWSGSNIDMDLKGGKKSLKQWVQLFGEKLNKWWWVTIPMLLSICFFVIASNVEKCIPFCIIGGAMSMLTIVGIIIKILIAKGKNKVFKIWDFIMKMIPDFIEKQLPPFANLKIRLIKRMLQERVTSVIKMVNEVFLKQVRRLNYMLFYTDEKLADRRITALIYDLTEEQFKHSLSDEKEKEYHNDAIENPGDRIYKAAKIASEMETTLWFSGEDRKADRLKNLVACGQFTACYKLLNYCYELDKSDIDIDRKLLETMKNNFQSDWNKFINDPYWLHNKEVGEK